MSDVFEEIIVVKRSGQRVNFDGTKIAVAIKKAFDQVYGDYDQKKVNKVYQAVLYKINEEYQNRKTIQVEQIQDVIEEILKEQKFKDVYEAFNDYRLKRSASRDAFNVKQHHKFVKAIEKIGIAIEDGNDAHPIDLMYKFASVMSQEFAQAYLIDSKYVRAHDEGSIYIPSLDVYSLALTSSASLNLSETKSTSLNEFTDIILEKLFQIKQEQYGEHIINNINLLYKSIILNEFKKLYYKNLVCTFKLTGLLDYIEVNKIKNIINDLDCIYLDFKIFDVVIRNIKVNSIFEETYYSTLNELENNLFDCIKKLLLKLNSFNTKINNNKVLITIGSGSSKEESLFLEKYLLVLAELECLDNVTTVYQMKDNEPKEIILSLASLVSGYKNIKFTKDENVHYLSSGIALLEGQTLLTSITINLARLGIKNRGKNLKELLKDLEDIMDLAKNQLMQRFELQANKCKENYKYLFNDNMLLDTNKLEEGQKIRKILRNGVLCIDYVGLCDCVCLLKEKENFECNDVKTAMKIVEWMNSKIIQFTNECKIKFVLAENNVKKTRLSLLATDKSVYGLDYLLDKKDYFTFNKYVSDLKLDRLEEIKLYSKIQSLTQYKAAFKVKNNIKKIMECLELCKNNLSYYEISVGNNDNWWFSKINFIRLSWICCLYYFYKRL